MSQVAICCSAECAKEHVGLSESLQSDAKSLFKRSSDFSCPNHLTGNSWAGTVGLRKASHPHEFEQAW